MMKPPIAGPSVGAASIGTVVMVMTRIRSCLAVDSSSTIRPTGAIMAAALPCRIRAATKIGNERLRAQNTDATVNSTMALANTLRAPKRSVIQPPVGNRMTCTIR